MGNLQNFMNDLLQQPEIAKATPKANAIEGSLVAGFTSKTY